MNLIVTKEQDRKLKELGLSGAKHLKSGFKKSVQDQEKIRKQAAKIRAQKK